MATIQIPIGLGVPDTSGDIYPSTLNAEMSLTNAKYQRCMVMEFPTGTDLFVAVGFTIPQDYVGSPVLVIKGVLDGTPANVLAFGAQINYLADSEAVDAAYETEDLANNSTWTGYADEDMYIETITLTPASAFVAGDYVLLRVYRDDSVDTTTFNFLLTDLLFQYANA